MRQRVRREALATRSIDACIKVKGTTGELGSAFLTSGEMISAQTDPDSAVLAVVDGIGLDKMAVSPVASGGTLKYFEMWCPEDEALTSIA